MKRMGCVIMINEGVGGIGERKGADRCQSFGMSGLEVGGGGAQNDVR